MVINVSQGLQRALKTRILTTLCDRTNSVAVGITFNALFTDFIPDRDELDIVIAMMGEANPSFEDVDDVFICKWDVNLVEWIKLIAAGQIHPNLLETELCVFRGGSQDGRKEIIVPHTERAFRVCIHGNLGVDVYNLECISYIGNQLYYNWVERKWQNGWFTRVWRQFKYRFDL